MTVPEIMPLLISQTLINVLSEIFANACVFVSSAPEIINYFKFLAG